MSVRAFNLKLHPSATGASILQSTVNRHRGGALLKGLIGGTGVTITAGANDITISADGTETSTFWDSGFSIVDQADVTKRLLVSVGGVTTDKDATLTFVNTDDAVYTYPAATDTLVGRASTDTLTNKTLTGAIITDTKRTSASVTKNASDVYANVTGLSFTVVPGTYAFELNLPSTVASGTGGIKYAFNYTTAVLSALEATAVGTTATAIATQHTTSTTTQADLYSEAAVVLNVRVTGTMVVTTGGTVDVQVAQNTSNASNTVALIGGNATFTRIA